MGKAIGVCIIARNTLIKDLRTIKEAQILSQFGLQVTVIGLWAKDLPKEEVQYGFKILRIPRAAYTTATSLISRYRKLTKVSPKPVKPLLRKIDPMVAVMIRRLARVLNKPLTTIALTLTALRLRADYYHAHFPLSLLFATKLGCILRGHRFVSDYNDIIALATPTMAEEYYEQKSLWGRELNERELRRISDTIAMIPSGVSSILDVGCGDGRITNRLVGSYKKVVGLDISQAALQHVRAEAIVGSVDNIPFGDRSFDLVLATELLEHLPQRVYRTALEEIKRVAKQWVLIGVPWREQLSLAKARCPRCCTVFHVNYHERSFNEKKLKSLLYPEFQLVSLVPTGGERRVYNRALLWIRHHIGGVWTRTPLTICPKCKVLLLPSGFTEQNAITKLCDRWNNKLSEKRKTVDKSHVLALYERGGVYAET